MSTTLTRRSSRAREQWTSHALDVVRTLARTKATFTADDVWGRITMAINEPRALGQVMREAVKQGIIEKTSQHAPSKRRHGTPIAVWRSLNNRFANEPVETSSTALPALDGIDFQLLEASLPYQSDAVATELEKLLAATNTATATAAVPEPEPTPDTVVDYDVVKRASDKLHSAGQRPAAAAINRLVFYVKGEQVDVSDADIALVERTVQFIPAKLRDTAPELRNLLTRVSEI